MSFHWYSPQEIEWLKDHVVGTPYKKLTEEFNKHFGTNLSEKSIAGTCTRYGFGNGRNNRFVKGQTPWNKGKPQVFKSEESRLRSQTTLFKEGSFPPNTLALGEERETGGYVYVKVKEQRKAAKENWKLKHRLIYEKEIGPIPRGWVVIFIDGNHHNFDPKNLMAVPKRAVAIFNHFFEYSDDPEVCKTNWLLACLKAEASYRAKEEKGDK